MLQVYTGTGKGKTTAALGAAFRAYGYGLKAVMFSFLKNDENYGEIKANQKLELLKIYQVGRDAFVNFHNPDKIDLEMAKDGWENAKKIIADHSADIVILDEINLVLATGMLPVQEVVNFLQQYQHKMEIITTGRGAPKELTDIADLVTDMQEVKHYLSQGVVSRNGFDH
ncbi:MAG: cob(I)yrinic acid a,c-diamide adenosyltransferase [Phascolarctobacterium sp.]|nr:cob(I)yrinic acid a,c-diamide adenosyltransferase [Candidatus Phascolarctobacterium caballi]